MSPIAEIVEKWIMQAADATVGATFTMAEELELLGKLNLLWGRIAAATRVADVTRPEGTEVPSTSTLAKKKSNAI